jgi:hypothetical protein
MYKSKVLQSASQATDSELTEGNIPLSSSIWEKGHEWERVVVVLSVG